MSTPLALFARLHELQTQYKVMFEAGKIPIEVDDNVGESLEIIAALYDLPMLPPKSEPDEAGE